MSVSAETVKMKSFTDLFGAKGDSIEKDIVSGTIKEKIIYPQIDDMYEFEGHPFQVKHDKKMAELIDSIAEHGVLVPGIVRKRPVPGKGTYEIVSGHCRREACLLNGLSEMPMILKDLSDAAAKVIMVDSNIQREDITIKEKAFAYKIKLEALKELQAEERKQSFINKEEKDTKKVRTDQLMAQQVGESRNQIQRYIRLTNLNEKLLDLVDIGKIPLNAGYEISFISILEQEIISEYILETGKTPTQAQAEELRAVSKEGYLNKEIVKMILKYEKEQKNIVFKRSIFQEFFPETNDVKEIERLLIELLKKWKGEQHVRE